MQGPGTGSSRRVGPSSLSTWGQSGLGLAGGGRPLVPTAQRHPPARASFLCAQSPDLQNKAGVFCKPSVWGRGGGGRETKGAQSGINCVSTGWAGGGAGSRTSLCPGLGRGGWPPSPWCPVRAARAHTGLGYPVQGLTLIALPKRCSQICTQILGDPVTLALRARESHASPSQCRSEDAA